MQEKNVDSHSFSFCPQNEENLYLLKFRLVQQLEDLMQRTHVGWVSNHRPEQRADSTKLSVLWWRVQVLSAGRMWWALWSLSCVFRPIVTHLPALLAGRSGARVVLLLESCAFLIEVLCWVFCYLNPAFLWRRHSCSLALSSPPGRWSPRAETTPVFPLCRWELWATAEWRSSSDAQGELAWYSVWLPHVSGGGFNAPCAQMHWYVGSENHHREAIHSAPSWLRRPPSRCFRALWWHFTKPALTF